MGPHETRAQEKWFILLLEALNVCDQLVCGQAVSVRLIGNIGGLIGGSTLVLFRRKAHVGCVSRREALGPAARLAF